MTKKLMGWEEIMTENMSKDAIIHAWEAQMKVKKLAEH
jgi:hexosaminidase